MEMVAFKIKKKDTTMAFCSSSSATKTSKSYKLTYFDARGRGEISRMVMAAAWQKYEDDRVKSEDWPKLKPSKNHILSILLYPYSYFLVPYYSFCLSVYPYAVC